MSFPPFGRSYAEQHAVEKDANTLSMMGVTTNRQWHRAVFEAMEDAPCIYGLGDAFDWASQIVKQRAPMVIRLGRKSE